MKDEQKTKAQLSREVETYAKRLSILNQMSQQMNLAKSENEVFKAATRYASQIFPVDRVSIALFQKEKNQLEVYTLRGEIGELPIGKQLPVEGTLIGKSIKEKQILRVSSIVNNSFLDLQMLSKDGMQSFQVAPMVLGNGILGTLNLAAKMENAFTAQDEILLLNMADFLCVTIDKVRKTLALQKKNRELEKQTHQLKAIASKLSQHLPPQLYQSIFLEKGIK